MSTFPDPRRRPWCTIPFCPGSRPDGFGKALAAGADAVCLVLGAERVLARAGEAP